MVQDFRPIDDTFFEVFANDCDVCQEILRVILNDCYLVVESVEVQKNYKNLVGRFYRIQKRIQYLKKDEEGVSIMCEVMEKYAIEYAENEKNRGILAALKKGIVPGTICEVMGVTPERVEKIRKTMEDNLQS